MRIPAVASRTFVASILVAVVSACSGNETSDTLVAKAKQAMLDSDPRSAEIHLKNLLQLDERNAEARFLLGEIYRKHNDLLSAEKEYRRALELGWDAHRVLPPLLATLLRLGEVDAVIEEARKTQLDSADGKADVLATVGQAHMRLGRAAEAEKSFAQALAVKPDHVEAQVGAAMLQARKDPTGARAAVEAILQRAPRSVPALMLKADLDLVEKRLQPARETYRKVATLTPYDIGVHARIVSLSVELNELDAARSNLAEIRKFAPKSPIAYYLQAMIEAREDRPAQAAEAVQEALRLAPDYLPAVSLAAGLSLAANSLGQSERHARTMIERAPQSPVGYRVLGATLLRQNQPDRALEAVKPGIAQHANDPLMLSIAGEASLKMNQPDDAAEYFARAAKAAPRDAKVRTGLALAHLAGGERERGIEELEHAIELDSNNLQADVALVMTLLRNRELDKALMAAQRMEEKAPRSPVPPNLRGGVLVAKGDTNAARSAFEQALLLDPAYYPAAANLASLDLRENRPGDARQRYESVLAKDPKNAQAAVALAEAIRRTGGTHHQVLEQLRKSREANPDAVLPILASARYLIETNAPKDAIPMLQEAANRNPESVRILEVLGTAYSRSGQSAQAIATWEKLLRIDPKAAGAHVHIGQTHLAGGNHDAALQSFRKASEAAPEAIEPRIGTATALYRQGRKGEAVDIAKGMAKNDRTKAAGLLLEGDLLAADRKWSEAGERYRGAFAAQRTVPIGAKTHRALRAAEREAEAEIFLRDWVRAEPANLAVRMYAGEAETQRKRWKEAFEHYAVVLERQPKSPIALNNAAWALHELKDTRALDYGRRAYEAAPKTAAVIDTYGTILAASGDRRSVELLHQAVELAPEHPALRLHLAQALAKFDDRAGARAQLEMLLKATPGGPVAEAARELQGKLQ